MAQYGITGATATAIADSVEAAMRTGRLGPGDGLPTVRALARTLRVSPTTVAAAYRTLRTRGLASGRGRRGTRVHPRPPLRTAAPAAVPAHLRNLADGGPDPALLPPLAPAVARLDLRRPHLYGEPSADPALLRLAARQLAADGIPSDAVTVTGGALDGLERVLAAHLRPGDRVAVEDPGYTGVLDLLGAMRLVPEPVAVDDGGPLPDDLERAIGAGVAAAVLTPRAQNPTGAAFDAARARALRRLLARHPDLLVIEDDHAGPVAGAAVPSVATGQGRWAVVRSVSKSLGPDLRLAILAGDAATIARVEGRQRLTTGWVSHLLQGTVAALWTDADVAALLQTAAATYARRRTAMVAALAAAGIPSHGGSGLNVWVPVPEETAVVTGLAAAGWAVRAGERFRLRSGPAIRITIARLEPPDAIRLAADLARVLAPDRRTPAP